MASFLGIDIGGTASRWVAMGEMGDVLARGATQGASGHIYNPAERSRLRAVLSAMAGATQPLSFASVGIGITGYGPAVQQDIEALIFELFGIAPEHVELDDDIGLAFRAVFEPGMGHIVSAGTGSIGLHITRSGEHLRVGGRGLLVDDGGSGGWIALRAIDRVYRRIDETGLAADAAILARELFDRIGGSQWDDVRQFVYGSDRGRIGSLAQAVARAAEHGDAVAAAILQEAAAELARLARALITRVGPLPVAFVGRVIGLHPIIGSALKRQLRGAIVSFPEVDAAAEAARRLAEKANQS